MRIIIVTILSLMMSVLTPANSPAYDRDGNPDSADIARLRVQAEKGDPEAQYDLAEAYLKGEGVAQSEKEAAKWYYRSAMQGYVDAQIAMGFVYRGGSGMPMDKVLSYMWFDLATKNGSNEAFSLRNDEAWTMTEAEIDEAREKSRKWRAQPEKGHYQNEED